MEQLSRRGANLVPSISRSSVFKMDASCGVPESLFHPRMNTDDWSAARSSSRHFLNKNVARSLVWCPGMQSSLEEKVKVCSQFQRNQIQAPPPIHPWEWSSHSWSRLHLGFAGQYMGHIMGPVTTDGLPGILDCMDWFFLFQFLITPHTTTGMNPR